MTAIVIVLLACLILGFFGYGRMKGEMAWTLVFTRYISAVLIVGAIGLMAYSVFGRQTDRLTGGQMLGGFFVALMMIVIAGIALDGAIAHELYTPPRKKLKLQGRLLQREVVEEDVWMHRTLMMMPGVILTFCSILAVWLASQQPDKKQHGFPWWVVGFLVGLLFIGRAMMYKKREEPFSGGVKAGE